MEGPQEEKEGELFDNGNVCKFSVKRCIQCGRTKPLEEFHAISPKKRRRRFRRSFCKECDYANQKKYREADPEIHRKWQRKRLLKSKYGMTPADFDNMLEGQKWLCAICGTLLVINAVGHRNQKDSACLDHDHATGKVRKILCFRCNLGIGHFGDNIELLKLAIAYLENHKG